MKFNFKKMMINKLMIKIMKNLNLNILNKIANAKVIL